MFSVLHICSYLAAVVAFLFVTLSLASGLLYIAELVEEHSRLAKLTGQRTIYTVIVLHLLFCIFDKLPIHLTAFGIFCHVVYLQNFSKTWPFISLSSLKFIASCLLVILDHFAWFFYFAERARETANTTRRPSYRSGSQWDPNRYGHGNRYVGLRELSFMDVATFFGVCVWLVPFFLFLSLSANDNVLPSQGDLTPHIKTTAASDTGSPEMTPADGTSSRISGLQIRTQALQRSSILKVALDPIINLIPRIGSAKFRSSRSQRNGLIASPTPSAPPSPSLYGGSTTPAYFGNAGPFSPSNVIVNGMSGYDSSSLSPQTPFNNRFGDSAALRAAASTPQLRSPPVPKRSATSPVSTMSALQSNTQTTPTRSPSRQEMGMPSLPPAPTSQTEDRATAIGRSVSPFAGAGQSAPGLVSRRKNT